MEYNQFLAALGLNQVMAESLVFVAFALVLFGIFLYFLWKYIIFGLIGFFIITFVNHHNDGVVPVVSKQQQVEPKTEKDIEQENVLKDCISLTHNPEICKDHVSQRGESDTLVTETEIPEGFKPAEEVKLLSVDNPAYLMARSAALQLPGAIILHSILR